MPSRKTLWFAIGLGLLAVIAWALAGWSRKASPTDAAVQVAASASARAAAFAKASPTRRPRAAIFGRVVDETRSPVAEVSVCAWVQLRRGLTTEDVRAPKCVVSDATGAYALKDIYSTTPLQLTASAPGHPPELYRDRSGESALRLDEGEQRSQVDFTLRSGGVQIHGTVSDVTGGVVAGALVVTESDALTPQVIATSNDKGEFALWVEPGAVRLQATANGYATGYAGGPAPGHTFALHLVPGATLVGRVVEAAGETPVEGVHVEAIQVEGGAERASSRTDAEGKFRVSGLPPGRYRVEATSEAREGYSRSSITLGMGETSSEVLVKLDAAYVVRGRVLDAATHAPCTGGEVVITDDKQNEFSEGPIEPNGWVRMASVIPGTYRVEVSCKGHVVRDDYPKVILVDHDAPELTWEVEEGGRVRVTLLDGAHKPVPRAAVLASPTESRRDEGGRTDRPEPDGTYLITGLKPGKYEIQATAEGDASVTGNITVSRGEERTTLELPETGVIEGSVEDQDHKPVPNAHVVALGESYTTTRTLDDGTFVLKNVPSGEYVVRVNQQERHLGEEDEARDVKVTLKAPKHEKVTLHVERSHGVIEGRVTDRAGQPVTDAFLDFASAGQRMRRGYSVQGRAPVVTDTEGRFKIDDLSDGDYSLRAYRKGGGEATAEHVKTGTRDLTLKLDDGGAISGSVTLEGKPVERFEVVLTAKTGNFRRGESFFHAAGEMVVRDLPAGTYEIIAETPTGTATTTVTLAEGEQKTGVNLALELRGVVEGRIVELETGAPMVGAEIDVEGESPVGVMGGTAYRENRTGADGRFQLDGVLAGSWALRVENPEGQSYGDGISVPIQVGEGGGTTNIGTIKLPRKRLKEGESVGQLGVMVDDEMDAHATTPLTVSLVIGPAVEAGIQVGDVITTIDGFDVTGGGRTLFRPLTNVAVGRKVDFGLSRGVTISVVATPMSLSDE
jgi:hypothetical protein